VVLTASLRNRVGITSRIATPFTGLRLTTEYLPTASWVSSVAIGRFCRYVK
jgi:hypothetical protein